VYSVALFSVSSTSTLSLHAELWITSNYKMALCFSEVSGVHRKTALFVVSVATLLI
jgi:hypothetical protein